MTISNMKLHLTWLLIVSALIKGHQLAPAGSDELTAHGLQNATLDPSYFREPFLRTTSGPELATLASLTTSTPAIYTITSTSTSLSTTTSSSSSSTTTTTTTQAPPSKSSKIVPDCPAKCNCTMRLVDCSHQEFTELPKFNLKSSFVEFNFHDNHLEILDFKQLPLATIEKLIVSDNLIRSIVGAPTGKRASQEIKSLRVLDLSNNLIQSLDGLNTWRTPQLIELNLALNQLTKPATVNGPARSKLERLSLAGMPGIKLLDDWLSNFSDSIQYLNLSGSLQGGARLSDQAFAKKDNLEILDLSNNKLVEVPVAIRSITSIRMLILNKNALTSLRPADFINQDSLEYLEVKNCPRLLRVEPATFIGLKNLKKIIITNNPRFYDFSGNAFYLPELASISQASLHLLDLNNNSISSMANPMGSPHVFIRDLRLANNPWNCDCQLEWLVRVLPANYIGRQPIHCNSPLVYKDLEITEYFQTVDCQPCSSRRRISSGGSNGATNMEQFIIQKLTFPQQTRRVSQ